ncbi:hypothetical protein SAMN02910413_1007 [Pseudobutyrivibrio sp. C4]|uniref:hypothetical protein n=1 Tax=Pseudobutyrivibrio sp. C4 TaxID=1520803 RepID=UPI0008B4E1E8|nr:hypothetical protein [Pseudobutyrivibrio sp. C4]SES86574.1 hypothetical protein SAMN02910413_1007 [Pseudobutyrivibrio sp. C4]
MKKNVVKAMSVGLSAITIASSLSVPVFAEESTEGGQPAEPITASQEAETNVAEQTVVNDTAALNESYNGGQSETPVEGETSTEGEAQTTNDTKSTLDKVKDAVNTTNATFEDDDTYSFKENSEVRDELGNVVVDENGEIKTEEKTVEGNYKETAADAQKAAEAAGKAIAAAATDAEHIKDAAGKMDAAATDANTAVGNAESAASDVTSAVNKAQQDANAAVVAVATDSQENAATLIATAQQSVADAQQTYNEKAEDLADAKSAYNAAKVALEKATEKYQDNISAATKDLGDAEKNLATLQAKVDELEKAVENAQNALAKSAAYFLVKADEEYAKSGKTAADTNKYIAAVIENFYLVNNVKLAEGQELTDITVNPVENTSNFMNVTYKIKDQDGNVVKEEKNFKIGFSVDEAGVVSIYEERYEYTYKNDQNEDVKVSITEKELNDLETERKVVKRYGYTGDDKNATPYITATKYASLEDEEKAQYTLSYVLLGDWSEATIDQTTVTNTKNADGKADQVETVSENDENNFTITYFDAEGNYVKQIQNISKLTTYKYVNNVLTDVRKKYSDDMTAESIARADIKLDEGQIIKEFTGLSDSWTVTGFYIPRYTESGETSDWYSKVLHKRQEGAESQMKKDVHNDELKEYYDKHYYYATSETHDLTTTSGKRWGVKTWEITDNYTVSYDKVTKVDPTSYSLADLLSDDWTEFVNAVRHKDNETIKQKIAKAYEQNYNCKVSTVDNFNLHLDLKLPDIWNSTITGTIGIYVAESTAINETGKTKQEAIDKATAKANSSGSYDAANSKVAADENITREVSYSATLTKDAKDTYDKYAYSNVTAYKKNDKGLFVSTEQGYTEQISGTDQTLSDYATLLKQLAAAKTAVDAAQDKVTVIQGKIDDLGKDGAILSLQVFEWELRLADAQKEYDAAKATLDAAKAALNTATQAYSDKYPTIVPTTGGGATTTTGGAAPVVYATATTAAVAADEELVIPDDAVPAAGQARRARRARTVAANDNTTTIDEAETPLAGGDADDAVVEDTEDTTTVEEDLVPLAGEAQKGFFARTWWGWLLLIIAVLTGSTAYAKKKADAKKVK